MNNIRDKLKLKVLEKQTQKVKEVFCDEQQCDLEEIVGMVDDLVVTAISCGSSPHNYAELQRAKSFFVEDLLKRSEKYRVVVS